MLVKITFFRLIRTCAPRNNQTIFQTKFLTPKKFIIVLHIFQNIWKWIGQRRIASGKPKNESKKKNLHSPTSRVSTGALQHSFNSKECSLDFNVDSFPSYTGFNDFQFLFDSK